MATHTKIIEFYGLPACGKSTLENHIIRNTDGRNRTYCSMTKVTELYKKENILYKLKTFPFAQVLALLNLLFKLPLVSKDNWNIYRGFLLIILAYNYANKKYISDYLVIDHGIIQSIVSVIFGKEYELNRASKSIKKLLHSINVTLFVYCKIQPQESLVRLKLRNRKDSGRLDAIDNPDYLLYQLDKQKKQFDELSCSLPNEIALDMSESVGSIADLFFFQLCELEKNK